MTKLSIIIVSWNTQELLKKCLETILNYGKNIDYQLIIVDNNSKDKSQELLSKLMILNNKIEPIFNKKNFGFAKAVNQGLKRSRSEYILLLNPDTQIKSDTLGKSIEFMEQNQHCGVMGGKILNFDGSIQPSVRKFPSLWSQLFILLKVHQFLKPNSIKDYFAFNFDYNKVQQVDQVMGAFFLIRKKILEIVGYFDERFFIWFEEVDFCRRAQNANWLIFYNPEAEILHVGGASFSQKTSFKNQWQFNKSLLYYFRKHHGFLIYCVLLFFTPLNLLLAVVTSFLPFLRKFKKI